MKPFADRHILRLPEATSTNTLAMEMLMDSPPDGTVVLAYHQSKGKGQKGNHWETKSGLNLTFSMICYPRFLPIERMFMLSKITCLAVRACVEQWLPHAEVLVKWPNDVLLNGKKVAGILIENQLEGSKIQASVIGIGLNVNQLEFSSQIANKATSIGLVAKKVLDLESVMNSLLKELDRLYLGLSLSQFDAIDRQYLNHLYGYQEAIPIQVGKKREITPIVGIDKSGRMALMWEGRLRYFEIKEASILLD